MKGNKGYKGEGGHYSTRWNYTIPPKAAQALLPQSIDSLCPPSLAHAFQRATGEKQAMKGRVYLAHSLRS